MLDSSATHYEQLYVDKLASISTKKGEENRIRLAIMPQSMSLDNEEATSKCVSQFQALDVLSPYNTKRPLHFLNSHNEILLPQVKQEQMK